MEADTVAGTDVDPCTRCRERTARYRAGEPHDPSPCLELFHRAIVERDAACWDDLVAVYDAQVRAWCRRAGGRDFEDFEEIVHLTWVKFWQAFTPGKLREAGTVAEILTYLRLCAQSAVLSEARRRQRQQRFAVDVPESIPDAGASVDERVDLLDREALWPIVASLLRNERERVLVQLRFVEDLSPAQVQARRPDLFSRASEVHRVQRNFLDRLRRSPAIRQWLAAE